MSAWLLAMVLLSAAANQAPTGEVLWQQVRSQQSLPPQSQPYAAWCTAAAARREALLATLKRYLTLFPGGQHRLEAVHLELQALYDLGILRGGDFSRLGERAGWYLEHTPALDPAHWEAGWWQILCRRLTGPPVDSPFIERPDDELRDAWAEYVRQYPRSGRVPWLAERLFEDARKRGDFERLRETVGLLMRNFPDDPITARLQARLRRIEAEGRPFWLAGELIDTSRLDTRQCLGRPVLIIAWNPNDPLAQQYMAQARDYCRANPQFEHVGVSLAVDRQDLEEACARLGLDWPQFDDSLGPASHFARQWGLDGAFCAFVIDRQGRLIGWAEDEGWQELASRALRD
jgi:hypothetical protein